MPEDARDHEGEADDDGGPEHRGPARECPSLVAQGPESKTEMEHVAEKERRQERGDDLFLQRGVGLEVRSDGVQHEQVHEAEEAANERELDNGDEGGCWKHFIRDRVRPWCLGVVGLLCESQHSVVRSEPDGRRTVMGSLYRWE